MNFLTVERDSTTLEHAEFSYEISGGLADRLSEASAELTLGIRPEDIRLAEGGERNTISIPVSVVEPMGDLTHLYLDLGERQMTATVDGATQIESGDVVDIVFPEERIHLFDGKTGEAVKNTVLALEEGASSDAVTSTG